MNAMVPRPPAPDVAAPWRIAPFQTGHWQLFEGSVLIGLSDPLTLNAERLKFYASHRAWTVFASVEHDGAIVEVPQAFAILLEQCEGQFTIVAIARVGADWRAIFAGAQFLIDQAKAAGAFRLQGEIRCDYVRSRKLARLLGFRELAEPLHRWGPERVDHVIVEKFFEEAA